MGNFGQWVAQSRGMSDGALVVKDQEFNEICVIRESADRSYGAQNDADIANATLIAAAPELMAALQACACFWGSAALYDSPVAQQARAAIAKAKGK